MNKSLEGKCIDKRTSHEITRVKKTCWTRRRGSSGLEIRRDKSSAGIAKKKNLKNSNRATWKRSYWQFYPLIRETLLLEQTGVLLKGSVGLLVNDGSMLLAGLEPTNFQFITEMQYWSYWEHYWLLTGQ